MRSHSILQNTILLTLSSLALRCVSLMYQVYLSGTIGAAGMGKMQLILTAGGFAMTLGTSGVRVAAMNLTAREKGKDCPQGVKKAMSLCLTCGLLMSMLAGALLYALAPKIARDFVGDGRVLPALYLLGLSLPMNCLISVMAGIFTALGKVRALVLTDILERLTSILLTVLLLSRWAKGDLSRILCSVIGGSSLASVLSFLILGVLLLRIFRNLGRGKDVPMARQFFSLCIPLALSDYLRSGLSTLEQFLIPRGLGKYHQAVDSSMADYGTVSGMVFPVLMFPAALFYALSDLLVPELSRCRARGMEIRIRAVCARCLRVGMVFSCMVAGLLFLLAPSLGQFLYKSQSAGQYLRLFAPMILMLYPDALTDGMLKGLGEQVASVRYNTLTAACDVVLLWFLLPRWGMGGFVFTFAVSHGLNFFLSLRRLKRVTGFRPDISHALKTILMTALLTLLSHKLLPTIPRLPSLLLAGCVYVLMFLLLSRLVRVFHPRELLQYLPKKETPSVTKNKGRELITA